MTRPATTDIEVRLLTDADVEVADGLSFSALEEVGRQYGFAMGERDAVGLGRSRSRIRRIAATDPDGSVVAEKDGEVVGVGLAIRRGLLWFLSLLAVREGLQGAGIGRLLLDATLDYGRDCPTAMIAASPDPKALRRYGRAGFELHAGFEAEGIAGRSELPAGLGVRDGDWDSDTDFVDQLITDCRGAPYGGDLGWCREQGMRILIRDGATPADRAAVVTRGGTVSVLAAASVEAAAKVLWAAVAEATGVVTMGYLINNQQWAIDVALAARLPLKLTDTLCTRGMEPPPAYLPSGIWG